MCHFYCNEVIKLSTSRWEYWSRLVTSSCLFKATNVIRQHVERVPVAEIRINSHPMSGFLLLPCRTLWDFDVWLNKNERETWGEKGTPREGERKVPAKPQLKKPTHRGNPIHSEKKVVFQDWFSCCVVNQLSTESNDSDAYTYQVFPFHASTCVKNTNNPFNNS